ncbi:hypothetical protein E2C01_072516 [Portunus trituberculatus]|uniref:Uncharacterized protein n=1 Tax=Portunus trituberculatus TaxID=210409 RepID=A0A5B7I6X6_PORTR|nr:hypothetical protein [Portunus trituberculatus]
MVAARGASPAAGLPGHLFAGHVWVKMCSATRDSWARITRRLRSGQGPPLCLAWHRCCCVVSWARGQA